MKLSKLSKGDKVVITDNDTFLIMGFDKVSGEILFINDENFAFRCNETGAIETCDLFDDGDIKKMNS